MASINSIIYSLLGRRGSLHSHRPADALIDPAHAAILFRDSRGVSACCSKIMPPYSHRIAP